MSSDISDIPTNDVNQNAHQVFDFRTAQNVRTSNASSYELTQTVFLVGFMGAGKTSVARKLARYAGVSAIDLDTYIQRRCDMKIKDIFESVGEAGFRSIETETLRELTQKEICLISCGGGIVLAEENRRIITENGCVVYLQVTAAEAASRISNVESRPLFGDLEQAQRVIDQRLPLYEEVADIVIDTAGKGSGAIAKEVFYELKRQRILRKL